MALPDNIVLFLKKVWHALTLTNSNRHREKGLKRYFTECTDLKELDERQLAWKRKIQERNLY